MFHRLAITRSLTVAIVALGVCGCVDPPRIEIIPVFPPESGALLSDVAKLEVTPIRLEGLLSTPEAAVEIGRGEPLRLTGLREGLWKIVVRGLDKSGGESVYGETAPFAIEAGKGGEVKILLARSFAFNLVPLEPGPGSEALDGLMDHAATAFTDESGRAFVLVTGGRRAASGDAIDQAVIIDTGSLTAELLVPGLTCNRFGHHAFALETAAGPRVVIAGGDDECPGTIDVFDPATRRFTNVRLSCSERSSRSAVAEVDASGVGTTGNIVLPGNPRCVVDPLTGEPPPDRQPGTGDSDQPNVGEPLATAVSPKGGEMLVVTPSSIYTDDAKQGPGCVVGEAFSPETASGADAPLEESELVPLGNGLFLLVGTTAAEDDPRFGWALVGASKCGIFEVYEGDPEPKSPSSDFALMDLALGKDTLVFLAGGRDASGVPTAKVRLFYAPVSDTPPTWHDASEQLFGTSLTLRTARAGHAITALPNGSRLVIGGNAEAAKPVEIFVRGSTRKNPFDHDLEPFDLRDPPLRSMVAFDTTSGMDEIVRAFGSIYPDALYDVALDQSALFLFASADRGIGDGLLGTGIEVDGCASQDTDDLTGIEGVAWREDEGGWVAINTQPQPGTSGSSKILYSGDSSGTPAEAAQNRIVEFADEHMTACSWRQLARSGLDGLAVTVEDAHSNTVDPVPLGVNVLVWVTSGDDCSQGLYDEPGPSPTPEQIEDGILTRCHDAALDSYFRFQNVPEDGLAADPEFEKMTRDLVWDPADLIVAVVGATADDSTGCTLTDGPSLTPPRRVRAYLDSIAEMGGQTATIDLCAADGIGKADLDELMQRIALRNRLQACLPETLIRDDLPPAPIDAKTGRYLPLSEGAAESAPVAVALDTRCSIVYQIDDLRGDMEYHRVVPLQQGEGWVVRTNTDKSRTCSGGWLVALPGRPDQTAAGRFEGAQIVCLK